MPDAIQRQSHKKQIKMISKNKKNIFCNKQGFTLIEIIITASIIVFLSATLFQVVSVSDTHQSLIMNTDKIKAGVRLAQTYSLSIPQDSFQQHVCGFGIRASGSRIIVFHLYNNDYKNDPYACDVALSLDYTPPSPLVKINDRIIDLGDGYSVSGPDIFFKAPYGGVYSNGVELGGTAVRFYTITRIQDVQSKTIEINGSGKVSL
ncbi:MAG: prepilin-type N-terminal cleavage/methylation domain-containing protein [Candidatus Moranbacteria bacterium]|nr:prepilin-type N-terminal cleavage/methylation domain-containing protein [Candidatus Moranbacteria bacterium]